VRYFIAGDASLSERWGKMKAIYKAPRRPPGLFYFLPASKKDKDAILRPRGNYEMMLPATSKRNSAAFIWWRRCSIYSSDGKAAE